MGIIRLFLADSVSYNVADQTTTSGILEALAKLYEKPSASNKVFLMKKLFSMKLSEGSSIQDHLNEKNAVVGQLQSVSIKFEDEVRALLFLCSLPESWNSVGMAVSNSVPKSRTLAFEDVVSTILSENMRRKSSVEASLSSSALYTERGRGDHGNGD